MPEHVDLLLGFVSRENKVKQQENKPEPRGQRLMLDTRLRNKQEVIPQSKLQKLKLRGVFRNEAPKR